MGTAVAADGASGRVTPPPRGGVKRFFLKFTEKMGGIEKTEYSQQFLDTCKEIDNYKLSLEDLVENLIAISQRNSKFLQRPIEKMQFEYDENENPYEKLLPSLRTTISLLASNPIEKYYKSVEKCATLHRDFHRRTKRSLRDIRQFLCFDFDELCQARNGKSMFGDMGFGLRLSTTLRNPTTPWHIILRIFDPVAKSPRESRVTNSFGGLNWGCVTR